jgi:transcriptional regulator with XRE-family HTH domain
MGLGEKIRLRREELGRSQEWLAAALGVKQRTISKWELGQTEPKRWRAREIERALGLDNEALESASGGTSQVSMLQLMGHIGADQAVQPRMADAAIEYIEKPPGAPDGASAALVAGHFLMPVYRDGMVLIWWGFYKDPTPYLGQPCACVLQNGDTVIKIPERAERGLYNLHSINGLYPTAHDVRLLNVSPIEFTVRRANWRG